MNVHMIQTIKEWKAAKLKYAIFKMIKYIKL